jgi:Ran GTPase-activating protein (RanGAP) involved in mRNA processing and transport
MYGDCNSKIALQYQPPFDINRFANVVHVMENPLLLQHQNLVFNGSLDNLAGVPKMLRERLSNIEVRSETAVPVLAELLRNGKLTKTNLWFPGEEDDDVDEIKDIAAVIAANESLTFLNLVYNHMGPLNMSTILVEGLMYNRSITQLDISRSCTIMPEIIDSLCRVIRYNSTITVLNIADCYIGSEHGSILANALRENKTLKELDISYNRFGSDAVVDIITALQANPSLKVLRITDVDMGSEGAVALASLLDETNPLSRCRLIKLSMFRNHIGESGIRAIAHSLASNKTLQSLELDLNEADITLSLQTSEDLTYLDLSENAIKTKGEEFLAIAIGKNRTLKVLRLSQDSNFGDSSPAIVDLGGENGCCLEELNLSNCSIGLTNLGILAESLQRVSTITNLNLSGNKFPLSSDTERILGDIISHRHLKTLNLNNCNLITIDSFVVSLFNRISSLTELILNNNMFGDRGACELAAALKTNTILKTLSLCSCNIGGDGYTHGASALADALTVNKTLHSLMLGGNPLGEAGVKLLADALPYNRSLRQLTVSQSGCGDGGAATFAHALAHGSSIVELEMVSCGITNTGAIALAEGSVLNSELRKLYLVYNKIGEIGRNILKKSLLQNLSLEKIDVRYNFED